MPNLTHDQLLALKADILADPVLAAWAATGRMSQEIADAYNLPASPAWYVWRTAVTNVEWRAAIIGGGGAGQLDALTASKRGSLLWAVEDTLDPSSPNVRAALDDFCGSQNTLKAAIQAAEKRTANRAEKLFSTGAGSQATPATMGWEGTLTYQDVEAALAEV
jgi:hypothetical protein